MKLAQLIEHLTVLETNCGPDVEVTDICCDSRRVTPGAMFVAIEGFQADGHSYIPMAAEKGASVVLCTRRPEEEVPFVCVEDTRHALAETARVFYGDPAAEMQIIGVTGTNGKTTTTTLIKKMLEDCLGTKVGLIGTNANLIGDTELPAERTTPESCDLQKLFRRMADAGCTHAVMEVSSHSLVLGRVDGIHFAAGIFTNLTQDHLDFHGTMEAYARAKAMLFARCDRAAVNIDDDWAQTMQEAADCPVTTYSARTRADVSAGNIRLAPHSVAFTLDHAGTQQEARLGIPGMFSVYNALAVLSCAVMLNIPTEACLQSLAHAGGVKGRVEVVPAYGDCTVLIDYAHTPDALENVLKTLKEVAAGRVVAVFGCGGDRDRTKRPIMGDIAARLADFVVITSDNPRTEDPTAIIEEILPGLEGYDTPHVVIPDRREAIGWALAHHQPGDVICLAGKGHETYQEVGRQKFHMDEREIVAQFIEEN